MSAYPVLDYHHHVMMTMHHFEMTDYYEKINERFKDSVGEQIFYHHTQGRDHAQEMRRILREEQQTYGNTNRLFGKS